MVRQSTSKALLLCASAGFCLPQLKGVRNHWVGNTFGTPTTHVQNFLEDMSVDSDGSVRTWSFYDEGQHRNSVYKDGVWAGFNFRNDTANPTPSRNATFHGTRWQIRNFWGRSFLYRNSPPPVGDSAPYIVSSRGDTIRSVPDPTAIAIDASGLLYVGDNGPDQNIKVFQVPTSEAPGLPVRLLRTIGETGGVFAQPRGRTGPHRFWGIRGLGFDSAGRLYVGCTGMPMQVAGGTQLSCFANASDTATLIWKIECTVFVSDADVDPASDSGSATGAGSTHIYKNAERYRMDWSRPPGPSATCEAVTLDPFRYPQDMRLWMPTESVWMRRIRGRKFLFTNSMYGSYVHVYRFETEAGSEIAVPAVFLPLTDPYRDSGGADWAKGARPVLGPGSATDTRRWIWRDSNGDGQPDPGEFQLFNSMFSYFNSMDVDDSGDIWIGGGPSMVKIPFEGIDANGVPIYRPEDFETRTVPFNDDNKFVMSFKYVRGIDAMILSSGQNNNKLTTVYRFDRWSEYTRRYTLGDRFTLEPTWRVDVPHKFPTDWNLMGIESAADTFAAPNQLTADPGFVYVGYVDKGPDGWRNGEVTVMRMSDGQRVGWIAPGAETGGMSGWFDLNFAINVFVRPNQERLLLTEDDYGAKVQVYRWCPEDVVCSGGSTPPPPPPPEPIVPEVVPRKGGLDIALGGGVPWTLDLFTAAGRFHRRKYGIGAGHVDLQVSDPPFLYARFRSDEVSRTFSVWNR